LDCLRVEAEKTSVNAALLDIESALLKVETAISALIEVSPLEMISHKTTSDQVIERLRVRFGVPKRIPSDILARLPNSLQGEGQLLCFLPSMNNPFRRRVRKHWIPCQPIVKVVKSSYQERGRCVL
jgi:hypothetical protein